MKLFRSRLLSLLVAGAALTNWGCSSLSTEPADPMQPDPGLVGDLLGGVGTAASGLVRLVNGLLVCTILRNDVDRETIGRDGGTLRTDAYSLVIPAGALSRNVSIKMEQVSGRVNSVRFSPEGLRFAKPVRLTMSYSNCRPNPRGVPNKIVYTDENLRVLEVPPSRDDARNERVVGDIDHFSRYAIAW
jgi:hypothetical protein